MSLPAPDLRGLEFSRVHFILQFQSAYRLTEEAMLRLRRNLRQAARVLHGPGDPSAPLFDALFDPPLSSDPMALRRYQRPGPPFVLHPVAPLPLDCQAGDQIELQIVFWGKGVHECCALARVFSALGRRGFHRGAGMFELVAIETENAVGSRMRIWQPGQLLDDLPLGLTEADWWIDHYPPHDSVTFDLTTPARLLRGGAPMFRPSFVEIFPFILRRVTSMTHAYCSLEPVDDPSCLLEASRQVLERESGLHWKDWRSLHGNEKIQDLGGVVGSVVLEGEGLESILWVLRLGSLLNLGKGAAFACGHFTLE